MYGIAAGFMLLLALVLRRALPTQPAAVTSTEYIRSATLQLCNPWLYYLYNGLVITILLGEQEDMPDLRVLPL
jgi:hypothetical protein